MSLNYDMRNVRPDLAIGSEERQQWWLDLDWDKFQSLVFNMIPLGINDLKDPVVFYDRYVMYYTANGYDLYYDYAFVAEMKGLRTNVTPKTDAAFNKECVRYLQEFAAAKRIAQLEKAREKEQIIKDIQDLL